MNSNQKLFAFKLADKNKKSMEVKEAKWKAREGVAVAGCTTRNFRYNDGINFC